MIATPSMFGKKVESNERLQAAEFEARETGLGTGLGANVRQAFEFGVESFQRGIQLKAKESYGEPIDEQTYKTSPYFREDIPYYQGMTKESAAAKAEWRDEKTARQIRIDKADTVGVGTAAYIAGSVFEPLNLFAGVATGGVAKGMLASKLGQHVARKSVIGARLGAYGTEGLVAAAVTEPVNIYSAKMLRDDYTMADSGLNVAGSVVASALLGAGGKYLEGRQVRKSAFKAKQAATEELDAAVMQTVVGQKIDVEPVRIMREGEISKKPITEKAAAVENFVRYTETPEFKARFEGSKVVDESGAPLRVYHGTNQEIIKFGEKPFSRYDYGNQNTSDFQWFSKSPEQASNYAIDTTNKQGGAANLNLSYLNAKNLKQLSSLDDTGNLRYNNFEEVAADINKARAEGYDAVEIDNQQYVVFSPDQIISAFGADDMDAIAARLDAERTAKLRTAAKAVDTIENDTAIDLDAANLADQYDVELQARTDELILAEQRISDLKEQGLLDNDDLAALEALSEFNPKDYMSALDAAYICMTRG